MPDLSDAYPLTPEQITAYQRDGFIVLSGVCSAAEVAAYRPAIVAATLASNREQRPIEARDTYGKAFLQTQNIRRRGEVVRRFVMARRFAEIAADLMAVSGARIFHDQSLFKEPGGGGNPTPWHQDQFYWPFVEPTMIGLWMPLVDVEPEMGGMRYVAASHKLGRVGELEISDESDAYYNALITRQEMTVVETAPMRAGDACFHAGWTLHAAGPNASDRLREAMVVTYFADGMRVAEPANRHQEADRLRYLAGRVPGELADSDRNPLVFART